MKRFSVVLSLITLLFLVGIGYADTTYTVKKGDTLFSIARKHDVAVADLKKANSLKSTGLNAGTKLVIPGPAAAPEKKSAAAKNTTASKKSAKESPAAGRSGQADSAAALYTVKKGDTLKSIARKHSLSVRELKELNSLQKESRLKVGQRLTVKRSAEQRKDDREPKVYTVKKGDTLRKVAKRFKVAPETLKEINALTSEKLKPGQKLLLAKKPAPPKETRTPEVVTFALPPPPPPATAVRLAEVKTYSQSTDLEKLSPKERLVLFAKKMLHLPYRFGGTGAFGLDCSAYVQKAYGLVGVTIPRSAREQFSVGEAVERGELATGDLVFFRTYASFPSHVGIYIGNNLFIHASSMSKKVTIDSLESPYYFRRYIGAKRVIPDADVEVELDDVVDAPAEEAAAPAAVQGPAASPNL